MDEPLGYVPQLLPTDAPGFAATGRWRAAMIAAPQVVNPGTRAFCRLVAERTDLLLVDPRTATYQFEGYMSMEEARAVPYSPGRGTLGALWEPRDFAHEARRRELIDGVFALQESAGAGVLLAPYFAVPRADHPWLEIAVASAREALASAAGPVGVVVQVELDALLGGAVERVAAAWRGLKPALWVVIVTELDERMASPEEARAVLDLLEALGAEGSPVVPAYTGRFGLVAVAHGARGLAGGALELEAYPRRFLREGLVNLRTGGYYLPGAMLRLPVREAEAVIAAVPETAAGVEGRPTRLVQRRRLMAALEAKRSEVDGLLAEADPRAALRERLATALERCRGAADEMADTDTVLAAGAFHYLEVLLELVGGPAATRPQDPGM